jgi:hypothetical protein
MQSTEMHNILPKSAAALFASMENQDDIDFQYLMIHPHIKADPMKIGQQVGIFDDVNCGDDM